MNMLCVNDVYCAQVKMASWSREKPGTWFSQFKKGTQVCVCVCYCVVCLYPLCSHSHSVCLCCVVLLCGCGWKPHSYRAAGLPEALERHGSPELHVRVSELGRLVRQHLLQLQTRAALQRQQRRGADAAERTLHPAHARWLSGTRSPHSIPSDHTNDSVNPGPVHLSDSVNPGPVHMSDSVNPGPVHMSDSVNPGPVHMSDSVNPGPVHLSDSVNPGPVHMSDSVNPGPVHLSDSVNPGPVHLSDSVNPGPVHLSDSVNPGPVHLSDSYPLSTSRNQVLVQSQCYCQFLVGSTGEPFKNRLLFHRQRANNRARTYVTEYVSCPFH